MHSNSLFEFFMGYGKKGFLATPSDRGVEEEPTSHILRVYRTLNPSLGFSSGHQ
jgi:hypothetical protein